MSSTYSPNLRVELIGTGDQAGTWGSTTNTNLGTLLENAVSGYVSVSITSANQALTALNGADDQARNAVLALTTTTGANFAVYAPPAPKTYVITNSSAYTVSVYNSTVLGNTTAAGTGVAVPAGKTMTIWSDGTNMAVQLNHLPTLSLTSDLGIGKTPTDKALELYASAGTAIRIQNSTTGTSGGDGFLIEQSGVDSLLVNYEVGSLKFYTTGGERACIDPSGNVGINTSAPARTLHVKAGGVTTLANSNGALFTDAGNAGVLLGSDNVLGYISGVDLAGTAVKDLVLQPFGGNLLVGTTAALYSNQGGVQLSASAIGAIIVGHATGTTTGNGYINFNYNASAIGSITQNGTTAVAYNTSSDYRLKENIAPITGALSKIAVLKPVTYTWKAAPEEVGEGFIAHELAEVCPHAVTGGKDAVDADGNPIYQGIDTSFLVATLTAAIQEQQAIIESLTARVSALEGN